MLKTKLNWSNCTSLKYDRQIQYIKKLISNGDINEKNRWSGNTQLYYAASNGDVELIKILLVNGADINITNRVGKTPLCEAVCKGRTKAVKALIEANAMINGDYVTPLHIAAENNRIEICNILIMSGTNVNAIDKQQGTSPMHYAARENNVDIIDILYKSNANINLVDKFNMTPLHFAVINRYTKAVKRLIRYGADLNITDIDGDTPLLSAILEDGFIDDEGDWHDIKAHLGIIKILISNGANFKDTRALHRAVKIGNKEIVRILLKEGIELDLLDELGKTVLDIAISNGDTDLIRILIGAGSQIIISDHIKHKGIVKILIKSNIDPQLIKKICKDESYSHLINLAEMVDCLIKDAKYRLPLLDEDSIKIIISRFINFLLQNNTEALDVKNILESNYNIQIDLKIKLLKILDKHIDNYQQFQLICSDIFFKSVSDISPVPLGLLIHIAATGRYKNQLNSYIDTLINFYQIYSDIDTEQVKDLLGGAKVDIHKVKLLKIALFKENINIIKNNATEFIQHFPELCKSLTHLILPRLFKFELCTAMGSIDNNIQDIDELTGCTLLNHDNIINAD